MRGKSCIIIRERLLKLFNSLSDEGIVYICASAGTGKTVAVRQWLDAGDLKGDVVSLCEYDNDTDCLSRRLCTALKDTLPQNAALNKVVSNSALCFDSAELALSAADAVEKGENAVLVIDDLHLISDEGAQRLILLFLERLPDDFRIVLISREDLPPRFSDFLLSGRLRKITAEQLRFSGDEIVWLYAKHGISLASERSEEISRLSGGWAICLNALLMAGDDIEGMNYLGDFIRANIWEGLNEPEREFMLNTALARELSPSLCEALTGISESERILDGLMRKGAFIWREADGAYHYYNMFRRFLEDMLKARGDEYLFSLVEKEGEWHYGQNDFYGAVDCFIRLNDHKRIAKCFDMPEISGCGDFVTERMLTAVKSPEVIAAASEYPFLLYTAAWAAYIEGRFDEACGYMDKYYSRYFEITEKAPEYAYNIFLLRIIDFRRSLYNTINEISVFPAINDKMRAKGTRAMNMPLLHRGIRDFSELAGEYTEVNIAMMKDGSDRLFGEEAELLRECLAAGLLYEQGFKDRAHIRALKANAEIKEHFAAESVFCAMSALCTTLDSLGQKDDADRIIESMSAMLKRKGAHYLSRNLNALITRRRLSRGDIKAAEDWLSQSAGGLYDRIYLYRIYEELTTARAYIASGNYDYAIIKLLKISELVTKCERTLDIIEAKILLSVSFWKKKRGFQERAIRLLEEAVLLAYRYGFTQAFANEGAELSGIMRRLQGRAEQRINLIPVGFTNKLLYCVLENREVGLTSGQPAEKLHFTDKQMAVMRLLCDGRSYKESVEILGIKLPTLRSHISLIYKKLDVTSKTDAVVKIKALDLLTQNG